jgi:hypothetical protein
MTASKHVVFNGVLINTDEVAFAYDVPAQDVKNMPPGYVSNPHVHIQFRHGHTMNVPNLTVEGLKSLADGAVF